ncbi:MAG: PqqD family protein, partial [Fimbriimonadales bacterium]|nr:PqqD family protein [Fimbriimonadales bacterium]
RIELDETGSTVWNLCDGQHNVESIVQRLTRRYKLERREAEYALFAFLNTLVRRGFVAYSKRRA